MPLRPKASTRRPSRAGIVQIAEKLGISPSTVSRALRPETAHLVREDSRKQILELAEKQNYTPHAGARMMRQGVNATLSVVVPMDENIFFSEYYGRFLSGVLHSASSRGWDVHISALKRVPTADFRQTMQYMGMDSSGVIYLAEPLSKAEVQQLKGYRRPFVMTKSALPSEIATSEIGVPVVGVDNVSGAQSAASLLLQLGHRRIGLILGPDSSRDAHERRVGYLDVLEKSGTAPSPEWIHVGPFCSETGREGMARLFSKPDGPTAVCCASDEIAFGAILAASELGLRCPEDISIIGFDDGLWATACKPALTTVRQPLSDLAERAVSLVVEAANTDPKTRRLIQYDLAASLVIRGSTQALAQT